jgi:hypothetical protein
MDKLELLNMLGAIASPVEIAHWLRTKYLPELISRFNSEDVRKLLGLYQGDRIPDNERNLTDVSNRVSLIVEYELARLSNQILLDAREDSLFWGYVVANRFPDLEVRKADGTRCLRIEVKNLQSIAEEKSANFDTLKKDLNPLTDFVVVFLWEWGYADSTRYSWDRSPKLLDSYVFHAMSLAALRDSYWLNRPPECLGGGHQGFDLRYAVNCSDGIYAEEEGNYGKLLRIWQAEFPYPPPQTPELQDTETEYLRFKQGVVLDGFWSLCSYHLPRLSPQNNPTRLQSIDGKEVGAKAGDFGFFTKSLLSNSEIVDLMRKNNIHYAVAMTEKYVCTGLILEGKSTRQLFNKTKPKLLSRQLFGLDGN